MKLMRRPAVPVRDNAFPIFFVFGCGWWSITAVAIVSVMMGGASVCQVLAARWGEEENCEEIAMGFPTLHLKRYDR